MKKQFFFAFLIFAFLSVLSGCANDTLNNSVETATSSSVQNVTEEPDTENGSYMAQMNFVERKVSENGTNEYVSFLDGIVYNGGTLELYAEFLFSGDRKTSKV